MSMTGSVWLLFEASASATLRGWSAGVCFVVVVVVVVANRKAGASCRPCLYAMSVHTQDIILVLDTVQVPSESPLETQGRLVNLSAASPGSLGIPTGSGPRFATRAPAQLHCLASYLRSECNPARAWDSNPEQARALQTPRYFVPEHSRALTTSSACGCS
jgi:hypothetical protein